jgi:hypothetical protein
LSTDLQNKVIFQQVVELLQSARQQVLRTVNSTMTLTYFEIGRIIVEEEQKGKDRAEYGKQLLKGLSEQLIKEFGKGFSVDVLERIRKFYLIYSKSVTASRIFEIKNSETVLRKSNNQEKEILIKENSNLQIVSENFENKKTLYDFFKLTWSHYTFLIRIDDENERQFYEIESEKHNWSVRELKRQYGSALYTRLSLSRDKVGVLKLSEKGQIIEKPKDIIKDPYILEFLGLLNCINIQNCN